LIFAIVLISGVSAAELTDDRNAINLRYHASIFTDTNAQYNDLNELIEASKPFKKLIEKTPSILGMKHWLKIDLKNNNAQSNTWMLKLGYPGITYLDAYWVKGKRIEKFTHLDQNSHFDDRPVNDPLIYLPLTFSPNEEKTLYLYYQTIGDVPLSLMLETKNSFEESQELRLILNSLLIGFLCAIFLIISINTMLNNNKTNFYYACFMLSVIFIISDISGYNYKYLWPNISGLAENVIGKFFILLPCLQLLFIKSFLETSSSHKKLNKVFNGFIYLYWLLLALSFFLNIIHLALVLGVLLAPFLIYTAIWSFNQKVAAVKIFSISLISHVIFINILTIIGSLHGPIFAEMEISSAIKIGYFIEAILFTAALAWQSKSIQISYLTKFNEKLSQQADSFKQSNQQLENEFFDKINNERNTLLSSISHELRTPLTVMQMDVESLQYNVADDVHGTYADIKNKIQDIDLLLSHFNQITCDTSLDCDSTNRHNVHDLFTSILKQYFSNDFKKIINLHESLDLDEASEIVVNQEAIKQLVNCLLDNCIHFSITPVQIHFSINEVTYNDKGAIKLLIEDSAPSVPVEHLENIFTPLFRVEASRSKSGGGRGMGLSLCKQIVASFKGEIWAEESKLGGIAITIIIPAVET